MNAADFDIERFLAGLTSAPGVYRMFDAAGELLYVGKARNLKRRVASYFTRGGHTPKVEAMIAQTARIEVTVTHTETEALLLENNLIKRFRPRFNVVLRDDKSYPWIHVTDHPFPRITFYRGARREKGRFFGPFPSAHAVREAIGQLQKLFLLRGCTDVFFANRTRPCLQYQIHRCSAPCVGYIDATRYREDVEDAVLFLEGRSDKVIETLAARMDAAAAKLDYERAARYRDQIAALRRMQEKQHVSVKGGDLDAVAVVTRSGIHCVAVLVIRGGRSLGTRTFFPRAMPDSAPDEVLAAFLPQYYLGGELPPELVVSHPVEDVEVLQASFGEQLGRRVTIRHRVRGERARWLALAVTNAEQALALRLAADADMERRFEALAEALGLPQPPARIECFDVSHTMGEATVAACVVFGQGGAVKADYRRYNIRGVRPGDDYGALRQALERRYRRIVTGEGVLPDLLLIDGGQGQLAEALRVLDELHVTGIAVAAVAKGETRRPGFERIFVAGREGALILPADSSALHLVQQVRDEAHRFAIAGHRGRRAKARRESPLEAVAGLGPARRRALLKAFGGLQGVSRAGVEDLARVRGISREIARRIYDLFHRTES